jgi:DNA polymerase-1
MYDILNTGTGRFMTQGLVTHNSVGDLMKLSMRDMDQRIEQDNFDANTLLQVHDELVYEVRDEQLEPFAEALEEEMETPGGIELDVPMEVDAEWGSNWKQCK